MTDVTFDEATENAGLRNLVKRDKRGPKGPLPGDICTGPCFQRKIESSNICIWHFGRNVNLSIPQLEIIISPKLIVCIVLVSPWMSIDQSPCIELSLTGRGNSSWIVNKVSIMCNGHISTAPPCFSFASSATCAIATPVPPFTRTVICELISRRSSGITRDAPAAPCFAVSRQLPCLCLDSA